MRKALVILAVALLSLVAANGAKAESYGYWPTPYCSGDIVAWEPYYSGGNVTAVGEFYCNDGIAYGTYFKVELYYLYSTGWKRIAVSDGYYYGYQGYGEREASCGAATSGATHGWFTRTYGQGGYAVQSDALWIPWKKGTC